MYRFFVLMCFILLGEFGFAQEKSPGFVSPVDHQIRLTGNFMELRPNHFHAGIDIKSTNGQSGDVIRNVFKGHISRIKVQSGSYGNALYIDHPNGYTSVYAHLQDFNDEIAAYVKDIQYSIESFEVDIYLPDTLFPVEQKTAIGTMGNTGRSFGPHLHFELRDTKSEHPVNPELLGIGPEDTSAPKLESLHFHLLGKQGEVIKKEVKYFNPNYKNYQLYKDTIKLNAQQIGCGMQMFDRMDGSWNKNGIYSYKLLVDDSLEFSWRADEFSFEESKYINGFWDFERKEEHGQKVYLFYRSECNSFSFYNSNGDGIIELSNSQARKVNILVSDLHGNESECEFHLIADKVSETITMESAVQDCDTIQVLRAGYFEVILDENSLFTPATIAVEYTKENISGMTCPSITIGNSRIPVKNRYRLSTRIPEEDIEKWTMVKRANNGKLKQFGGDTLGGRFVCLLDELGIFSMYKDTTPPTIRPVSFSSEFKTPWKIEIKDNLVADGLARDLYYKATINGEWIRMRYDAKNNMLLFDDADKLPDGMKYLDLTVIDHCGNVASYNRKIK